MVYAHRGASADFAEHTRAAYLRALADGADGVECDVQLSRDQHVVLLHDANLDRTSDGTGPVAERTLKELRQLDFSSWKGVRIPEAYGPRSDQFLTLPDLLDLLRGAGRDASAQTDAQTGIKAADVERWPHCRRPPVVSAPLRSVRRCARWTGRRTLEPARERTLRGSR